MIETPNQMQSEIKPVIVFVLAWQSYLFRTVVVRRYLTSKSIIPMGKVLIVDGGMKQ